MESIRLSFVALHAIGWRLKISKAKMDLTLPVVIVGAAFRVAGLAASPLWYDEAVSLYMARLSLWETVRAQSLDFGPPLWELITWLSTRAFGANEYGMRLPSLAASLISLWLAHKLTRTLGFTISERFAGLSLAALLPYQFYLAQDGRVYAVMSALYLGAVLFALKRRPLGLAACCGLLLWSHATGAFYAVSALGLALARWPQWWRRWLQSGAVAAVSFTPWLPSLVASGQRHHWLGELTRGLLNDGLIRAFFVDALPGNEWVFPAYVAIAGGMLFGAVISIGGVFKGQNKTGLAGLAAVGPLVLMVAAASVKNVIFYRPLSALAIPLALWIGLTLPRTWLPLRAVFGYNWIMLLAAGLFAWSPATKGAELRALAERMDEPGAVVYHATATSLLPFEFLLPESQHVLLDESQHTGLLSDGLRDMFGLQRAPLEAFGPGPVYVVWARDALVSREANSRMAAYVQGGLLIGTVRYWQAAPIEVWLVIH